MPTILRTLAFFGLLATVPSGLAVNSFDIGDQSATIGDSDIVVPILVTSDDITHALSFSVKYDETKLDLKAFDTMGTATETALWSAGRVIQEEGGLIWAIILGLNADEEGFDDTASLPPGEDTLVAKLVFDVIATDAGVAEVAFQDDLEFLLPVESKNRLTKEGMPIVPALGSGLVTISEPPQLIRGRLNGDDLVDLGDLMTLLFHLFAGEAIGCQDAGDVNDDGVLDLADVLFLFEMLYQGGQFLAVPSSSCGVDPTGDPLGCEISMCP